MNTSQFFRAVVYGYCEQTGSITAVWSTVDSLMSIYQNTKLDKYQVVMNYFNAEYWTIIRYADIGYAKIGESL